MGVSGRLLLGQVSVGVVLSTLLGVGLEPGEAAGGGVEDVDGDVDAALVCAEGGEVLGDEADCEVHLV